MANMRKYTAAIRHTHTFTDIRHGFFVWSMKWSAINMIIYHINSWRHFKGKKLPIESTGRSRSILSDGWGASFPAMQKERRTSEKGERGWGAVRGSQLWVWAARGWFDWWVLEFCGGFKYFLFSPRKLGKIPILTNIFQRGWNHQLVEFCGWLVG